jgi:hypothetical protein
MTGCDLSEMAGAAEAFLTQKALWQSNPAAKMHLRLCA